VQLELEPPLVQLELEPPLVQLELEPPLVQLELARQVANPDYLLDQQDNQQPQLAVQVLRLQPMVQGEQPLPEHQVNRKQAVHVVLDLAVAAVTAVALAVLAMREEVLAAAVQVALVVAAAAVMLVALVAVAAAVTAVAQETLAEVQVMQEMQVALI
jgi:hypothetical protein